MFRKFCLCMVFVVLLSGSVQSEPVGVVEKTNGSISIIYPCKNSKKKGETKEEWLERIFTRAAGGSAYTVIDSKDLPKDRKDRDEWTIENKKVIVDVEKKRIKGEKKRAKEEKRRSLLERIGLTEEEFKELQGAL